MSVVRGTSLSNYAPLVHELGGDPLELMRLAGIRPQDVGRYDLFMPLRSVVAAVESAAIVTTTPDFGRRLAQRQGIEILGPVGVAARTAATVADAFTIFENYMAAYSPAISATFTPLDDPARAFFEFRLLLEGSPPMPQSIELTLGVALRVLRLMISTNYAPLDVYIPHQPLTTADDYRHYFGCTPRFAARTAGFTLRTTDLAQPLNHDQLANQAVVQYLKLITARDSGFAASAQTMVRQLLPTGAVTLELIAAQFNMHSESLAAPAD